MRTRGPYGRIPSVDCRVEDHNDARRYLDLFLGQLGAKVMVASNAFEGLELIKILFQI